MAEVPAKAPLVPTITGSPQLDTALGYAASKLGALAAGAAIAWMDAHGWNSAALAKDGIDMGTLIATTVGGIVLAVAAWIWGQYRTKWSQAAIVNNTMHAAITGEVPEAIAAKATREQINAVVASPNAVIVEKSAEPPAPSAGK